MVPKVAKKGRSFKGAGLYYLHDKGALTTDRVAFTEAINLPTRDPETAIRCMAYTAANQNAIKLAAGGSAKGRKLGQPVYTYSLSWSPEEQPTPEQMLAAARETLDALGLSDHEALCVAHNDEPHPHIHVIVNRVHPETGIAANLGKDHLTLSAWAEEYEKRQGRILCEQRVENNERRRRQNEFVKDRASLSQAEYHQWRRTRLKEAFEKDRKARDDLWSLQKHERETLIQQKERSIAEMQPAIKEQNRYRWAALYQAQNAETRKLKFQQASAWGRLKLFLRDHAQDIFHREKDRTGFLSGAFNALVSGEQERRKLLEKHEHQRRALGDKVNALRREAIRTINADHRRKLDMLKEAQKFNRDRLKEQQTEQSQQRARELKIGKAYEEWRDQEARRKYGEIRDNAADVTKNRPRPQSQFRNAAGKPPAPDRQDARDKASRNRYDQIQDNKGDITGPKPKPTRDFKKSAGKPPAPQRTESEEQDERRKNRYSAFRDQARDVTRDQDRGRTKEIKPPGSGKGPKGPKS